MSLKNNQKLDSLEKIVDVMSNLLSEIVSDLEKSNKGNKAASQRVRTGTVKLEKIAKAYRKESILSEKALQAKSKKSRKAAPAKAKPAAKPAAKNGAKNSSSSSSSKGNAKAAPSKGKAPARLQLKHKKLLLKVKLLLLRSLQLNCQNVANSTSIESQFILTFYASSQQSSATHRTRPRCGIVISIIRV